MLASRERAREELRARLRRKGFDPDVIEGVLDRLVETELLNDSRFAARYAGEAAGSKGKSGRLIQRELRARGIDPQLAVEASAASPEVDQERASELARRRAARLRTLPPDVARRRLAALLARRGYDSVTAWREASEALGGLDDQDGGSAVLDP